MTDLSPFEHERDRVLGDALRDALQTPGHATFVEAVLGRLGEEPATWWEVLGTWARPGIAAAILLAAGAGWWLGRSAREAEPPVAVEEVLAQAVGNGSMSALLAASPPDVGLLFVGTDQRE